MFSAIEREKGGMTRLILGGGRGSAVIGDLRDPEVDEEAVARYHLEAGRARARASIAAQRRWIREHREEGPLGYILVFMLILVVALWVRVIM